MSGSSPKEGSPRRIVYRVRSVDGEFRSRDGKYTREGAFWGKLSHLKSHRRQSNGYGWKPFKKGDQVVEYEIRESLAYPVEALDR